VVVVEFHTEAAFDHEEHFVFVVMVMEDERTVEFDELDVLSIKISRDMGLVAFADLCELFGDVDFGHEASLEEQNTSCF
jgi:hypothetical protein